MLRKKVGEMKKSVPPKLERFPAAKQRRLDQLLEKNSEGTISIKEKEKLEALVAQAEQLMVVNARRLAEFAQSEAAPSRTAAVPVTVWVQAEHADFWPLQFLAITPWHVLEACPP
jgi:hypothetical protein